MNSARDRRARPQRTSDRHTGGVGGGWPWERGERRSESDEAETRVLNKSNGEESSTDTLGVHVLEALQEQPLMTKRMLIGAFLVAVVSFRG